MKNVTTYFKHVTANGDNNPTKSGGIEKKL
jgi:hypothetical protein